LDATSFNYSNIGECGRSKKNSLLHHFPIFLFFEPPSPIYLKNPCEILPHLKSKNFERGKKKRALSPFTLGFLTELEKMNPIVVFNVSKIH